MFWCSYTDTSFDANPPVDCNDEYWETADPEKAFKQPEGKPSKLTAFTLGLDLLQLLSFTQRTIVSRYSETFA